ncbi:MAG: radical SAM protein, partial [Acidobacteria bacterium]|nr:radical SAM protein [Acidobacteriota bacterium]
MADYVRNRGRSTQTADAEVDKFLSAAGFDGPLLECSQFNIPDNGPSPSCAVLLMTNRCNLRCVYCYANAGEESKTAEMTWPTAKSVIDYVIENAARVSNDGNEDSSDAEPPSITFHGGGEPTVHWDLMVRCVEYAGERDARTGFSMSSNGVWSSSQRRFICRHFRDVSLSMDGVPSVQNVQRPAAGGGESFTAVMESIREMDAAGVEYGIRMTVMEDSIALVPEGVQFICGNTRANTIQIEPTFTDSRGRYADISADFADAFADRFIEAWEIGRQAGCQVYYSGARPWVVSPLFCQAPLKAAVATADDRLVACFEVFSEDSPLAGGFTVGRVNNGVIEYDRQALQAFLDAQQRRRRECEDCF